MFTTKLSNIKLQRSLLSTSLILSLSVALLGFGTASAQQNYYGNSYGNNNGYNAGYGQQPAQQPYGQSNYAQPQGQLAPLQGRVVTAPAGTFLSASVQSSLSSEFARPGDRFNATLGAPVSGNGGMVLPAGSQLEGQVVSAQDAGRAGRNGQLEIRFTAAVTPSGQRVPMSARIQTEDGTGIIKGGTAKGRAGKAAVKTAVGAGSGAALGTAMGALSGGSVGRGAIYGSAIGGGLGLLTAGVKKGQEAVISSGEPLSIVLDTPITVSASAAPATTGYGQPAYGQQSNYGQQPQYGGGYDANNTNQNANPYGNPYTQPNNNSYYGSGY